MLLTSDGPDWAQPGKHECPAFRPGCEVLEFSKDERGVVAVVRTSDWQGDDGCEDEDEVHHHEDSLQLSHHFAQGAG